MVRYVYSGGERVFVHMFTIGSRWPFRFGPVLGDWSAVLVDSVGEQVFVFGTFLLLVGRFWGVDFWNRNRLVLVLWGMFVVYKCF